jgi:hypothetical protein
MTKGRAVLPGRVVAEQDPFSSPWLGPLAHDSSVENVSKREHPHRDLSTTLEMTKGRAVLPGRVVAGQEPFFITLGGPTGP